MVKEVLKEKSKTKKRNMNIEAWVARDKDGTIEMYVDYPTKNKNKEMWVGRLLSDSNILDELGVKWEDESPKHIEIKLTEIPE